MRRRSGWRWVAAALALALLVFALHISNGLRKGMRNGFIGTTFQLAVCLSAYAHGHGERYPDNWLQFISGAENFALSTLLPPWTHEIPASDDVDSWAYYTLVPGRKRSDPHGTILAFAPYRDQGQGGCVIYTHGWSEWLDTAEYQKAVSGLMPKASVEEAER